MRGDPRPWPAICVAMLMVCSSGCWQNGRRPNAPPVQMHPPREAPRFEPGPIVPGPALPAPEQTSLWRPRAEARAWKYIVLHHTATNRGSVAAIHEAHVRRKWLGIGYHFVIGNGNGMPDGEIEETFRWRKQLQGAHAGKKEYNDFGIGIAVVGNFEKDRPSKRQLAAVKKLVTFLCTEYDIDPDQVIAHSKVKATACPGKHFPVKEVRKAAQVAMRATRKG